MTVPGPAAPYPLRHERPGGRAEAVNRKAEQRSRRHVRAVLLVVAATLAALLAPVSTGTASAAPINGPLRTTGADSRIYDAAGRPVRLIGFNWTGTEAGGRRDYQKTADVCGLTWRSSSDPFPGTGVSYENMFQVLRDWGYNVVRLPVSWNNLEPVAPVWSTTLNRYVHTWNTAYVRDLKTMVSAARANGLGVILDMHQDYWSPALHNITNWDGSRGYCEGSGMPRWLYPSIDAKASTTQNTDFFNGMNWFFRNVHDPQATVTRSSPWALMYSAWDGLSYMFSTRSGYADAAAVVGADLINEPYFAYVGGRPPLGQTVLQAAGARLRSFYNALAPAVTTHNPSWLLFFEDSNGGYNSANPAARETPTMTGRPTAPGNWVYSLHAYNFEHGTFSDGVARHDDFGITLMNVALANARQWKVPLYIGEFTTFSRGIDARQLTDADMAETREFLAWAKQNEVSWTFWAYVNGYRPMTVIDPATNQVLPVVRNALDSGR